MNIHEYQAKQLLKSYGAPVADGVAVFEASEAQNAARSLPGPLYVVKSQIHAGGRGKGKFKELGPDAKGGVRLAKSIDEVVANAKEMLGNTLVTKQTGPAGKQVNRLYIEDGSDISKEFYLSMLVDRTTSRVAFVVSTEGGMDIEEVAHKDPQAIHREEVDPQLGLVPFQARRVARGLGLKGEVAARAAKLVSALVAAYLDTDASLAEVNPLMITGQGEVMALDAKMNFDDNALFRHKDVVAMRDLAEENALEVEASKYNLNYIKLDGEIGCMVNGAGLAMATMDIIQLEGSSPANFLDVGGSASQEAVANAFRILIADPDTKAVLINIFGGIARTDRIASGVVEALRSLGGVKIPVVVRLEGTNVEQGRAILRESEFHFLVADTMADAAKKVVASIQGGA